MLGNLFNDNEFLMSKEAIALEQAGIYRDEYDRAVSDLVVLVAADKDMVTKATCGLECALKSLLMVVGEELYRLGFVEALQTMGQDITMESLDEAMACDVKKSNQQFNQIADLTKYSNFRMPVEAR
jgi:hypothetical protein